MKQMRSEAEILASTDPTALPEESRFLLELDGDRYVKGDGNFHDKSYWLMAMKAAVVAGRRKSKAKKRRSRTSMVLERSRAAALAATRARVAREIRMDFADMNAFPFVASDAFRHKKTVVGVAARMAGLKSNKRYKPGD